MKKYIAILKIVFTAQMDEILKSSRENEKNFYHVDKI